jgi:hypothetical protein
MNLGFDTAGNRPPDKQNKLVKHTSGWVFDSDRLKTSSQRKLANGAKATLGGATWPDCPDMGRLEMFLTAAWRSFLHRDDIVSTFDGWSSVRLWLP